MNAGPLARAWLDTRQPGLLAMLEHLVTTESHAAQPEGVAEVASQVIGRLKPLGFSFTEVPQARVPESLRWVEEIMSPGVPYDSLASTYRGFRGGETRATALGGGS